MDLLLVEQYCSSPHKITHFVLHDLDERLKSVVWKDGSMEVELGV